MRLLNNGRLKKDDGILCENFDIGADLEEIGHWENLVENVEVIVLLMCHDAARCIHRQIFPTCDSTNNKKYS
jgi:hypothetical protein